jgi:2,4-dienoyl-CoA reductase-like NADH-dependent reductase (Old Yellow Enzyme family)
MASPSTLFSAIKVGNMSLQHRVVLASMSRLRVHIDHTPGPLKIVEYRKTEHHTHCNTGDSIGSLIDPFLSG